MVALSGNVHKLIPLLLRIMVFLLKYSDGRNMLIIWAILGLEMFSAYFKK